MLRRPIHAHAKKSNLLHNTFSIFVAKDFFFKYLKTKIFPSFSSHLPLLTKSFPSSLSLSSALSFFPTPFHPLHSSPLSSAHPLSPPFPHFLIHSPFHTLSPSSPHSLIPSFPPSLSPSSLPFPPPSLPSSSHPLPPLPPRISRRKSAEIPRPLSNSPFSSFILSRFNWNLNCIIQIGFSRERSSNAASSTPFLSASAAEAGWNWLRCRKLTQPRNEG